MDRRRYSLMVVALLALGALIEVAQGLMGWGRTADVWDFAADVGGVFAAALPVYVGLQSWMLQVERRLGLS
jgi:hypothetical protein